MPSEAPSHGSPESNAGGRALRVRHSDEVAAVLDDVDEPRRLEARGELDLMVVDCLAEACRRAMTMGRLSVRECQHHRPDAGVRDDRPRMPHVLEDTVEGEVVELGRAVGAYGRKAVLDDDVLLEPELRDRAEEAVERRLVGTDRDEDHRFLKTVPA